jgi:hypothetical protein
VIILIKLLKPIKRGGARRFHLKNDRPSEVIRGTGINIVKSIKAGAIKRAMIFLSLNIFSINSP